MQDPTLAVMRDGALDILYTAQPHQLLYHQSATPNLLMVGPRGTGKSLTIRMDSHIRAMMVPNFRYLTLRRNTKELKRTHLSFIGSEMARLGGDYHITDMEARYPNGSIGWFAHCEQEGDIEKHLGGQFDLINFDEATTFPREMFLKIAACARVPQGSGRIAMVRGGTNPMGIGAEFIKKFFIVKDVGPDDDEYEAYDPTEYGVIDTKFTDNKFIDEKQYRRRFALLPDHIRRAWLDGEWIAEGTYFADFRPTRDGKPWHVVPHLPQLRDLPLLKQSWVSIYRCLDWGYFPDPAVCLWIAVLPNGQAIVFKERTWRQTLAADVAKAIKMESEGMRIVETFADPSMFAKHGETMYSVGELIENGGVPLTPSVNDRIRFGYAIHDHLNTEIDGLPKLQILEKSGRMGCPNLIRTLPDIRIDPKDPNRIAPGGNDHYVVALAYFCIGQAPPSRDPEVSKVPRWMLPKREIALTKFDLL